MSCSRHCKHDNQLHLCMDPCPGGLGVLDQCHCQWRGLQYDLWTMKQKQDPLLLLIHTMLFFLTFRPFFPLRTFSLRLRHIFVSSWACIRIVMEHFLDLIPFSINCRRIVFNTVPYICINFWLIRRFSLCMVISVSVILITLSTRVFVKLNAEVICFLTANYDWLPFSVITNKLGNFFDLFSIWIQNIKIRLTWTGQHLWRCNGVCLCSEYFTVNRLM